MYSSFDFSYIYSLFSDVWLDVWFSSCSVHQNHLEGLFKQDCYVLPPVSDSVGLGQTPRICISNKFPSDAGDTGSATILQETLG